jgi:hypothetical protein
MIGGRLFGIGSARSLGIEMRSHFAKNSEVLRRMLERAVAEGLSAPSLERAAEAIVRAVKRDLRSTAGNGTTA